MLVPSGTVCLKGMWSNFQTLFIYLGVAIIFHIPLAIAFMVFFLKIVWLPLQLWKCSPVCLWFSAILLERWKCQARWQPMNWMFNSLSPWFYQKSFSNKFEIIVLIEWDHMPFLIEVLSVIRLATHIRKGKSNLHVAKCSVKKN